MSARDLSREIAEVKKRRGERGLEWLSFAIDSLIQGWVDGQQSRLKADSCLIRSVTFLEVFTREWIAILVDHGSPYVERATELTKTPGLRFDYELARAIQGRSLSLGELVGHSVPVNRLEQILSCFETLLDGGFARRLATVVDRWAVEIEQNAPIPILHDYDKTCRDLERLFEIRHIICHELPAHPVYELGQVPGLLASAKDFIVAGTELLKATLHGRYPLTTADMYKGSTERLEAAEAELDKVFQTLLDRATDDPQRVQLLKSSAIAWSAYKQAQCDLAADEFRGGNHAGLLWLAEAFNSTQERIDSLQRLTQNE